MSVANHGGPEVGVGVPGWDPSGNPQEGPGSRERGQEGGVFLEGEALRGGDRGLLCEAWPAWLGARGRGRRPGLQQLSPHLGQGPAPPLPSGSFRALAPAALGCLLAQAD